MEKETEKKETVIRWVIGILIVICLIGAIFFKKMQQEQPTGVSEGTLEVHYIDVGQADATLVLTSNKSVLIDTGRMDVEDDVINYMRSKKVQRLDYLIITHFDRDHFGEAEDLLGKVEIGAIVMPRQEITSTDHQRLMDLLATKESIEVIYANDIVGKTLEGLDELNIKILAPFKSFYEESNNHSIVSMVTYGENKFLFTGDLEDETTICKAYTDAFLSCDVYKVGHHGSKNSSGTELLLKIKPKIAVISCGENNDHNHPHKDLLDRLEGIKGLDIYRTDENGTIVVTSNGIDYTVKTEK
jgi:competence protein ComEC